MRFTPLGSRRPILRLCLWKERIAFVKRSAMADLEAFRAEVRDWLVKHAPKAAYAPWKSDDELCWGGKKTTYPPEIAEWLRVCADRGFTAPTWPREYGGAGLSKAEAKILDEEMKRLGLRPPLLG